MVKYLVLRWWIDINEGFTIWVCNLCLCQSQLIEFRTEPFVYTENVIFYLENV